MPKNKEFSVLSPLQMGDMWLAETHESIERSQRYIIRGKLGEGAFGEVRHGTDRITGQKVALKFIRVSSKSGGLPRAVFRELESLRQLGDCDHIVKLLDVYPNESQLCFVLEYLDSDLSEVISNARALLPISHVKAYSHMLLKALSYVHFKQVIHRDIKPSNILITSTGILKLADFGLARLITDDTADACKTAFTYSSENNAKGTPINSTRNLSHQVATRWYRPPELLFASRSYTFSADIWSAGVVIAELFSLRPIFPGNNDIDQMFRVFQIMGSPTTDNWPGVDLLPDFNKVGFADLKPISLSVILPHLSPPDYKFLQSMIVLDPCKRCTAAEAARFEYFLVHPLPTEPFLLPCPTRRKSACEGAVCKSKPPEPSSSVKSADVAQTEWEKESRRIDNLLTHVMDANTVGG